MLCLVVFLFLLKRYTKNSDHTIKNLASLVHDILWYIDLEKRNILLLPVFTAIFYCQVLSKCNCKNLLMCLPSIRYMWEAPDRDVFTICFTYARRSIDLERHYFVNNGSLLNRPNQIWKFLNQTLRNRVPGIALLIG